MITIKELSLCGDSLCLSFFPLCQSLGAEWFGVFFFL